MVLPKPPNNSSAPIPNNPFYSPQTDAIGTSAGPLIAGSGIEINYTAGTISATGGGGGGGVTSVTAGTGLTGGTITSSGTIALTNQGTPGTYNYPSSVTVDAQGRISAIAAGGAPVQAVSGTAPIAVSGTTSRIVSIASASLTAPGAVQLYNDTDSTSTALALTAAQGYALQQQINALVASGNLEFAGTFNALTSQVITVTGAGSLAGFAVGNNLPSPSPTNFDYFVIVTTAGTYDPPGTGGPYNVSQGDWFLSTGTSWQYLNVGVDPTYATTTVAGIVCLATDAQVRAGTNTLTALTPASAASVYIPDTCYPSKGSLLAGTSAACSPQTLLSGTNGQVLTVNTGSPTGLAWITPGGGSVTCIDTTSGIIGGPITSTGTIALSNTTVTPGSYTNADITVDAQGRVTAAANGAPDGIPCACITGKGVLITGTGPSAPVALPVGANGQALVADSTCTSGLKWLTLPPDGVTCVGTGAGLTGGPITAQGVIALTNTGVAAGSYPLACILVDDQGRITAATAGSAVTEVSAGTGLTGGPITSTGALSLADTAVVPGSYTYASITVDAQGRLTAASDGDLPSTTVNAPLTNAGTALDPVLGIDPASTTACGAVQLYDALDSPSTSLALTAAQGCVLQQQINALSGGSTIFAGTFNASTGRMANATSAGTAKGYIDGQLLPAPAAGNTDYYVIVSVAGSYDPPGAGGPYNATIGDIFISTGTVYDFLDVSPVAPYATTTTPGLVCLSTNALACAGTDNLTAITPSVGKATYPMNCSYGAKGTILAASAANTPTALGTGTNGQVLTVCTTCPTGLTWSDAASSAATPTAIGEVFGLTSGVNAALGCNALVGLTTGNSNTALGVGAGSAITTGSSNVAIGFGAQVAVPTGSCQLAIGFSGTCYWITGDSNKNVQFGAGIRDCAGCLGTVGQSLVSTGTALQWCSVAAGCNYGTTPVGTVMFFAASTPPPGWLYADGSIKAKASYPELADAIGNIYGCTATTFTLPDLRGQFLRGWQNQSGSIIATYSCCDYNRVFGSAQCDAMGNHIHAYPNFPGYPFCGLIDTMGCAPGQAGLSAFGNICFTPPRTTSNGAVFYVGSCDPLDNDCDFGTCETRPTNIAMLPCIKATPDDVPPPSNALTCCVIGGKGTIVTGLAPQTPTCLAVGANGQVLTACSLCPTGLVWTTNSGATALTCSLITAKGALITGTAACAPTSLPVGGDGAVLTACATCPAGMTWTPIGGLAIPIATPTCQGILYGCSSGALNNVALGQFAGCAITTGANNTFLGKNAGCQTTTGCNNVLIGSGVQAPASASNTSLAIGWANTCYWLTGDAAKNIRPGAGILDCANTVGTACQVLTSTGSVVQWASIPALNSYVSAGTIQSVGFRSTVVPQPVISSTPLYNNISYRQTGAKIYEIIFTYGVDTLTGANAGAGIYYYRLPNGWTWNFSVPWQTPYTGTAGGSYWGFGLQTSTVFASNILTQNYSNKGGIIVPSSPDEYRIIMTTDNSLDVKAQASDWFGYGENGVRVRASFEVIIN